MMEEIRELQRLVRELSEHKRLSTGRGMEPLDNSGFPEEPATEADFKNLVSSVYKAWREHWKGDIGFLLGLGPPSSQIQDFDALIYALRTSHQHTDNGEAATQASRWAWATCGGHDPSTQDDWEKCSQAVLSAFASALGDLIAIAARASRDELSRRRWSAKTSASVHAIVIAVMSDLGLRFDDRRLAYHVREVERRWSKYRLGGGQSAEEVIASFAEQQLVARVSRLPCTYDEILDELGVLGSDLAVPALLLAHALSDISGLRGGAFLGLLEEVWGSVTEAAARR